MRCHPHQETQESLKKNVFFISSSLTVHLLVKFLIIFTVGVTVLPAKPQQALPINIAKIAFLHTFYMFFNL
jgi:hypothetical protein